MKKMIYQTPEVKIKALIIDQLMQQASPGVTAPGQGIGWGGNGNGMEGDAKENYVTPHSVWDH